jgi:hypothetical protein
MEVEMTTDQRAVIHGLRELNAKRTQGEWVVDEHGYYWTVTTADGKESAFDDGSAGDEYNAKCSKETRDFLVALANACPELLDLAERGLAEQCRWESLHYPFGTIADAERFIGWYEEEGQIVSEWDKFRYGRAKQIAAEAQLAAVEAELDRLRGLLTYVYGVTGVIDNGHCVFCRRARLWTAAGANNPPLPCENPDCVTHEIDAKLAASPNQKAKVHGE